METVPFGIIGCGFRGRELALLAMQHGLPLVAVADRDDAASAKLAAELEDQSYRVRRQSVEQMLADPEIRAVVIATPTSTHVGIVTDAARAKKHILCEKPLAPTIQECRNLGRLCEESGVQLAVGSQCRLWGVPAFVKSDLIPRLGSVHAITMWRMVNTPAIALQGWRTDPTESHGGQLMDHHIHNVDLLNWMFGHGAVYGATASNGRHWGWKFPDQYHALLAYQPAYGAQSALCSFIASEVSHANEWSLRVDGEHGTLKVPAITWRQDVLERYPMSIRYADGKEEVFTPTLSTENPNVTQLLRFLHAVATGEPVDASAQDAAAAVGMIHAIIEKAQYIAP